MPRVLYCYGCGAEATVTDGQIVPCAYCGTRRLSTHRRKDFIAHVPPASDRPDPMFTRQDQQFLKAIRVKAA